MILYMTRWYRSVQFSWYDGDTADDDDDDDNNNNNGDDGGDIKKLNYLLMGLWL